MQSQPATTSTTRGTSWFLNRQNDVTLTPFTLFHCLKIDISTVRIALVTIALLYSGITSAAQSLDTIRQLAEQHALDLAQAEQLANARVTAGRLDSRLVLADCSLPLTAFDNLMGPLGQRLTVGIRCDGVKPWTVYVPVRIAATMAVVTLRSSLPRGTVLSTHHLALTTRERRSMATPPLSDLDQAVGLQLTRSIGPGIPLTTNMIKKPNLVTKGDSVMMVIERGSIRVSMVGKALEDGALGQRIRLNNVTSDRSVEGEVLSDGTIRVL